MAVLHFCGNLGTREDSTRKSKMTKNEKKRTLLVAQELKIARALAGNDKTLRDGAVKSLKKWFHHRAQNLPFTEDDFHRLWKGLFYSMWMSDKPLIQEECSENIASLLHELPLEHSLILFKCGLITLINEWFGIDQLRLDKFMMFVRRLLRQSIVVLKKNGFKRDAVVKYGEILNLTVLEPSKRDALGLFMHFVEIFMEELAKIGEENLQPGILNEFLVPFIKCLAISQDGRRISHLKKFIFVYLMKQSDAGLEYQDKYNAWKQLRFPGTIHCMQKVETNDSDEETSSNEDTVPQETLKKPLDPRAGRVDVELPQLKFYPRAVSLLLLQYKHVEGTTVPARNALTLLSRQFNRLAHGSYPLGVKKLKLPKEDIKDMNVKKAVNRLVKFEKKLLGQDPRSLKRKLKENKSDKKIKRKKLENGVPNTSDSDTNEEIIESDISKTSGVSKQKTSKPKKATKILKKEQKGIIKKTIKREEANESNIFSVDTPLKKKARQSGNLASEPESAFERNSGVWLVYNQNESANSSLDASSLDLGYYLESKIQNLSYSPDNNNRRNGITSPKRVVDFDEIISPSKCSPGLIAKETKKSPNKQKKDEDDKGEQIEKLGKKKKCISIATLTQNDVTPDIAQKKEEIEPAFSTPTKELFPKNPWDEPLEEGEYEICIPSKSYVEKLKKINRKSSMNVQELINNSLGKTRRSLDHGAHSTPQSAKKVKINTKLNMSQEFDEYHSQMMTSPAITFDASKKPGKPLLKTPIISSPINPFYKQLYDF